MQRMSLRACTEKLFGVPALAGKHDQRTLKRGHQTVESARRRISVHALSTEEIAWQVEMREKYGPNPADWLPEEKLAHYEKKEPAHSAVLKSLREEIKKAASAKKSRK